MRTTLAFGGFFGSHLIQFADAHDVLQCSEVFGQARDPASAREFLDGR